jgi:hypothetical protein
MHGILLDSENKEVRPVTIDEDDTLQGLYEHLRCSAVDVVRLCRGIDLWIDDEALLKQAHIDEDGTRHNMTGIYIKGADRVIMGNGLLLGCEQGESIDLPATAEEVASAIRFIELDDPADRPEPGVTVISWE